MIEPEILKTKFSSNFLLIKVTAIRIVARILAPMIILTMSLNPVNLTTPL